jgi:hypothetical protein
VSTEKWRERRWRLFSTDPFMKDDKLNLDMLKAIITHGLDDVLRFGQSMLKLEG